MRNPYKILESYEFKLPVGSTAPPDGIIDKSGHGHDGTAGAGATQYQLSNGLFVHRFSGAATAEIDFNDLGVARAVGMWVNLDSGTEVLFGEGGGGGVVVVNNTMVYTNWDDCFVDNENTDTLPTGWHYVVITSTTNVTLSDFIIGEAGGSNLSGYVGKIEIFLYEIDAAQIAIRYGEGYDKYQ